MWESYFYKNTNTFQMTILQRKLNVAQVRFISSIDTSTLPITTLAGKINLSMPHFILKKSKNSYQHC